ncbi:nucleoside-diphosphate kinase [archaeon CG10_big_fil_rev_8_21_14_0_10_43_11]|nr:MAG: nucleoside-diphosphate kinase [archaeon CG10_big_fil_rev_8_21_14_0_10_43_11]
MVQKTLVLIKPDGVARGLVGEIIKRFEQRGLKIIGLKLMHVDTEFAQKHYKEHVEKPFFGELMHYIRQGPVLAMVLEGKDAISFVRKLVGPTRPNDAQPGTIRGDFAHTLGPLGKNLIHASANESDAKKECELWFSTNEVCSYTRSGQEHHY